MKKKSLMQDEESTRNKRRIQKYALPPVLGSVTPQMSNKKWGILPKNGNFSLKSSMELVKLKKYAIFDSADQKMPFWARYPYFFDILGVAGIKIKSWIVKSVLRILIEGLIAEI